MESPASWNLLTATLALCDLRAPDRVWTYLVCQGLVQDSPGAGELFLGIADSLDKHVDSPGPSAVRSMTWLMDRAGLVVLPAALAPDPWGAEALERLEAMPSQVRDGLTGDGFGLRNVRFFQKEARRRHEMAPDQMPPAHEERLDETRLIPASAAENRAVEEIQVPGYRILRRVAADSHVLQYEAVALAAEDRHVLVQVQRNPNDEEATIWFQRISELAGRLDHPSIPRSIAADRAGERPYLILPALPEENLVSVVGRRGPLPAGEVVRIVHGVALALDYAHGMGVVHGDLHPSRMLLAADGCVQVTGFGAFPPPHGLFGNLHHLAPEQFASPEQTGVTDRPRSRN